MRAEMRLETGWSSDGGVVVGLETKEEMGGRGVRKAILRALVHLSGTIGFIVRTARVNEWLGVCERGDSGEPIDRSWIAVWKLGYGRAGDKGESKGESKAALATASEPASEEGLEGARAKGEIQTTCAKVEKDSSLARTGSGREQEWLWDSEKGNQRERVCIATREETVTEVARAKKLNKSRTYSDRSSCRSLEYVLDFPCLRPPVPLPAADNKVGTGPTGR
jgi:hypothetical protein